MHSIKLYSNRYLTQALLLFDPFCLSSFSHFAQNRTTIPTRKEIRARLYLEQIGNKYRIRSRRGTSCTCCRQGAWAAFSEAPEGQLQSPGGDPGCKGPESSSILNNKHIDMHFFDNQIQHVKFRTFT